MGHKIDQRLNPKNVRELDEWAKKIIEPNTSKTLFGLLKIY